MSKTAIVYDHGLYTCLAKRLAEDYAKVYYYVAQESPYPVSDLAQIGVGIDGIERVYDFHKLRSTADKNNTVFCFFDIYNADLQENLRRDGYVVFGAGKSEVFETNRVFFRENLKRLKMPVADYVVIKGVSATMKHLDDKQDKYIKTGWFRGDFESYHFVNMAHAVTWFDDIRYRLGMRAELIDFLIEDAIEGIEVGCDGFRLDGQMAPYSSWGYELKNKAYVCTAPETLPTILNNVNKKFAPLFNKLGYQGMYSNEVRITGKKVPYFTDPCCRGGIPPSELHCELYGNFGEIVWVLAHGKMPKPKAKAKYGAELILSSPWYKTHWVHVEMPEKIERWVKLNNVTKIDGKYYCVPNKNDGYMGAVVAIGDDPYVCLDNVMKIAKHVKAHQIEYLDGTVEKCREAIKRGEALGLKF